MIQSTTHVNMTILTSDGTLHTHNYRYPNTEAGRQESTSFLGQCLETIASGSGAIMLGNPTAIYNVSHIICLSESEQEE